MTVLVLLDLSDAFDTVDLSFLLQRRIALNDLLQIFVRALGQHA